VVVNGDASLGIAERRFSVRSVSGVTSDLGEIVMGKPATIAGHVDAPSTDDYDTMVVGIAGLGTYTKVDLNGNYLLTNVPPGSYTLDVQNTSPAHTGRMAFVASAIGTSNPVATSGSVMTFPSRTVQQASGYMTGGVIMPGTLRAP
jgi:hypothetical protein